VRATGKIRGPNEDAWILHSTAKTDREVERAAIIGTTAKYMPEARAP
jgi:2-keto-4-pentenoate hydratase/2-oxohepta-3-ene-1,7-dioic acid hydratase in catechol pathway